MLNTNGSIGMPFGEILTASREGANYSIAKATDNLHNDSFWKTRVFPVMQPGYLGTIDKIYVTTEQINADGSIEATLEYNQDDGEQVLDPISADVGIGIPGSIFKILNKSPKIEDFLLELTFTNYIVGAAELVAIRNILIMGHYIPEN